ncbi:unnamed protein product [Euphydryas editha]|uniref:Uncharacterized protein n=1 Tax=Euphydryas editha TaxID=104508 RepID=A0AAU9V0T8_EUPED|nr:unnamed protein product [Euphydryas editha]
MIIVIVLLLFSLVVLMLWTYCQLYNGICKFSGHLVGKVVIVTGANTGIGFETAKDLAQRGALVIAACRNVEKGKSAVNQIMKLSRNNDIHFIQLDLATFASIKKFVEEVMGMVSRVDILINNAGVYTTTNDKTEDGFLIGMQVNYLGPFLLTSLLLPILRESTPSRIINVSSMLYRFGRINFDNFENMRSFNTFTVYSSAKLFTTLMTIELDRQLQGSAQTTIYLSVSPDVEYKSGCYFKDCRVANLKSKAQNSVAAKKLWDISERLVKIR